MTHLTEEDLILLYYDEPAVTPAMREHLAVCRECAGESRALAALLDACREWPVPDPSAALAQRVRASLPAPAVPLRAWLCTAAATAAVLLLAFFAGRISSTAPKPAFAGLSRDAQHRILEIALADHLDRAELLLTEISNSSDAGFDQTRAQQLVEEGRLLRQSAERDGELAVSSLLDDVERFMLEAANSQGPAELRRLRRNIVDNSLLFKVRIVEANLRTDGEKS